MTLKKKTKKHETKTVQKFFADISRLTFLLMKISEKINSYFIDFKNQKNEFFSRQQTVQCRWCFVFFVTAEFGSHFHILKL